MAQFVFNIIKWLFPNPLTDAKSLIATLALSLTVYVYATAHADQATLELKTSITAKEEGYKKAIKDSQKVILTYLKEIKTEQKELKVELKRAIQKNSDKLWELSRNYFAAKQ
ncbi:MAG: hypothetical protein V3R67_03455 [Thermodesulfobacteriota bacterium]